jgi:hypothetical protein
MSSTDATVAHAADRGEEVTSGTPLKPYIWKKPTMRSKISMFLCGMPNGFMKHGDAMESAQDFVKMTNVKKPILKSSPVFLIR